MPATDERFTPPGAIACRDRVWATTTTDPCWHPRSFSTAAITYTRADDGLVQVWLGRVWLNPPWSDPRPWLELLIAHCALVGQWPAHEGMAMVKNDPSTAWWRRCWETADAVVFLSERTRYWQIVDGEVVPCGTPEFSSVVFYWGHDAETFLREWEADGHYGRTLPAHRRRMPTTTFQERIDLVLRDEIVAICQPLLETQTCAELRSSVVKHAKDHLGGNIDLAEDMVRVFDRMTVAQISGGSSAAQSTAISSRPTQPATPPKKRRPRKPKAKPQAEPQAEPQRSDQGAATPPPSPRAANDAGAHPAPTPSTSPPGTLAERAAAVAAWLGNENIAEFRAADVMKRWNISRQTATRTIQRVPGVTKVGEGAGSRYVVNA